MLPVCAFGILELSKTNSYHSEMGKTLGVLFVTRGSSCVGGLDPPSGSLSADNWETVKPRPRGIVPTWHKVWPVWGRAPERGLVGTALSHPLSAPTALARAIKSVSQTQSKPRSSTVSPQERPPRHWPGFGPQNS